MDWGLFASSFLWLIVGLITLVGIVAACLWLEDNFQGALSFAWNVLLLAFVALIATFLIYTGRKAYQNSPKKPAEAVETHR